MTVLQGLHGLIAVLLLCTLLFIDEAGVPLPVAPNEALLRGRAASTRRVEVNR